MASCPNYFMNLFIQFYLTVKYFERFLKKKKSLNHIQIANEAPDNPTKLMENNVYINSKLTGGRVKMSTQVTSPNTNSAEHLREKHAQRFTIFVL